MCVGRDTAPSHSVKGAGEINKMRKLHFRLLLLGGRRKKFWTSDIHIVYNTGMMC